MSLQKYVASAYGVNLRETAMASDKSTRFRIVDTPV
jgi:hypothetical protein